MLTRVVTSNVGGYDDASLPAACDVVKLNPAPQCGEHPRLAAKRVKMLEFPLAPSDYRIWIDANMRVTRSAFPCEVAAICGAAPLALWAHPDRDCIYDEAVASLILALEKYDREPIVAQVGHYAQLGHPAHAGLYACGCVVWNLRHPLTRAIAAAWLQECRRWSYQDQLSLPVVLRRLEAKPALLPDDLRANRWLTIGAHLRDD
jgi:hypothetical protein